MKDIISIEELKEQSNQFFLKRNAEIIEFKKKELIDAVNIAAHLPKSKLKKHLCFDLKAQDSFSHCIKCNCKCPSGIAFLIAYDYNVKIDNQGKYKIERKSEMEEIIKQETTTELSALEEQESELLIWAHKEAECKLRIGKALKAIRDGNLFEEVGFKSFSEYLDNRAFESLKIGQTQGYKYVKVYEKYGNRVHLPPTDNLDVLIELSKMPDDVVEQLEAEGKIEGMTSKEAQQLRRELEQANQQISLLTDEKEHDAEALREEQKLSIEAMEKAEAAQERIAELERLLKEAKSEPVEAVIQPDEETIKKIKAEAKAEAEKAEQKRTAKMEKALSDARNEADAATKSYQKLISEKTASDERIKSLEAKLQSAEKPADEQLIEFKFYFQETQANLKKFLDVLGKVTDPEKKAKFKGAATKFVEGILDELKKSEG